MLSQSGKNRAIRFSGIKSKTPRKSKKKEVLDTIKEEPIATGENDLDNLYDKDAESPRRSNKKSFSAKVAGEKELELYEAEVEKGRQLAAEVDAIFEQLGLGVDNELKRREERGNTHTQNASSDRKLI